MIKTILRKVPDEDVYYNFSDLVEIDETRVIIYGNRHFKEYGDKELLDVVSGEYYDDDFGYDYDTFDTLKKLTNKDWAKTTIRGYSQSDWQEVYYVKNEVSQEYIEEIENFYMGKVSEFSAVENDDEESCYVVYVPDYIVWDGKESICSYLDLRPETTTVYVDDGYERVIKYKEIK